MSASENNIEKQKRRHRGPLIGMLLVVLFVLGLLVWWLGHEVSEGEAPEGAATQMDSRTGETEPGSQPGTLGGNAPPGADNSPATAPATPSPAD